MPNFSWYTLSVKPLSHILQNYKVEFRGTHCDGFRIDTENVLNSVQAGIIKICTLFIFLPKADLILKEIH